MGEIAYMFQKDLLFPWRTVLGNASLGLEMDGLSRKTARERVKPYLDRFGLADFAHAYPDQLSGGMRQRVAFLRTMVQKRSIMLLDEPFGALDSYTRPGLQQWLMGVWDVIRTTVLFITHDVAAWRKGTVAFTCGAPQGVEDGNCSLLRVAAVGPVALADVADDVCGGVAPALQGVPAVMGQAHVA